ncbi:ankyrin repeat domain-containing protein [Endozoicomonas sp. GU-1]|uniref:ankyrin repeat domain-containing protein n=1 Tax=Endozoicomonas sp. GU-1 TaxID=3009078 RepID=UPI0022B5040B|nr:ankyrin repeat domain-containing protein [Endozoicomonas sp. GU-1]WBA81672.1 ankyrin repeat domain-containing protein [Endozoicomonas sp. GU-1]
MMTFHTNGLYKPGNAPTKIPEHEGEFPEKSGKISKEGSWNGRAISATPSQQQVPRVGPEVHSDKSNWTITKAISGIASSINNRMCGQSARAAEVSKVLKENNVRMFTKHLKAMRNEVVAHNKRCVENNRQSELKLLQEPIQQLSVNNKPLLYALAESGSPEMIAALCTADKIAPRSFYTVPVFQDAAMSDYVEDSLHKGELNEASWWCHSGTPVHYALSSGNYEAAKAFLQHGGSLIGCEEILSKIPQDVRDQLGEALLAQQSELEPKLLNMRPVINRLEDEQKAEKMGDGIENPDPVFSKDRLDITTLGAMAVQIDKDLQLLQSLAE